VDPKVLIGLGAAVVVLIGVVVAAVILTMNTRVGEDSVTHKPAEASGTSAPASESAETSAVDETQAAGVGQEVRDSVDTAVVFDVPKGTDVESIELHDAPFSDGVTVGL
jgi:hypothetical protein